MAICPAVTPISQCRWNASLRACLENHLLAYISETSLKKDGCDVYALTGDVFPETHHLRLSVAANAQAGRAYVDDHLFDSTASVGDPCQAGSCDELATHCEKADLHETSADVCGSCRAVVEGEHCHPMTSTLATTLHDGSWISALKHLFMPAFSGAGTSGANGNGSRCG